MTGLEVAFPGLCDTPYQITSPADDNYNCIAWAAGDITRWWWPGAPERTYWPVGTERILTIDAFRDAFATLGYARTDSEVCEAGVEKVALFATADGTPKHAARQLPEGTWTSKLGQSPDISHELHALAGALYGSVVLIMKRSRS